MTDIFIPRLRGNTFFLFLLRAVLDDFGVASSWANSSQGLTQAKLFANLMQTVKPSYEISNERTLQQYISQYLKGDPKRSSSKTHYPFKEATFQTTARMYVHNHYWDAVRKMDDLCLTFLDVEDEAKMKMLVGGLVSLIYRDSSISPETVLDTGFRKVTKAEITKESEFSLQRFLLSTWLYIVTNKPNAEEGGETYLKWTEDSGRGNPRRITTAWGAKMAEKIKTVSTKLPNEAFKETDEEHSNGTIGESEEEHEKIADDEPTITADTIHDKAPHVEVYEAPFIDPVSKREVLAQFHVENHGDGIAAGIVYGGITIGGKKKNE